MFSFSLSADLTQSVCNVSLISVANAPVLWHQNCIRWTQKALRTATSQRQFLHDGLVYNEKTVFLWDRHVYLSWLTFFMGHQKLTKWFSFQKSVFKVFAVAWKRWLLTWDYCQSEFARKQLVISKSVSYWINKLAAILLAGLEWLRIIIYITLYRDQEWYPLDYPGPGVSAPSSLFHPFCWPESCLF